MKVKVSPFHGVFAFKWADYGYKKAILTTLIFYLINSLGYSSEEVNTILLKKSGMLGLTGYSDLRDIGRS
jgi:hypothetical protein